MPQLWFKGLDYSKEETANEIKSYLSKLLNRLRIWSSLSISTIYHLININVKVNHYTTCNDKQAACQEKEEQRVEWATRALASADREAWARADTQGGWGECTKCLHCQGIFEGNDKRNKETKWNEQSLSCRDEPGAGKRVRKHRVFGRMLDNSQTSMRKSYRSSSVRRQQRKIGLAEVNPLLEAARLTICSQAIGQFWVA